MLNPPLKIIVDIDIAMIPHKAPFALVVFPNSWLHPVKRFTVLKISQKYEMIITILMVPLAFPLDQILVLCHGYIALSHQLLGASFLSSWKAADWPSLHP